MSIVDLDAADTLIEKRNANLRRLLNPKSIAVVGASTDPTKAGSQALKSLSSFPGTLVAVHPREREIQGVAAYPSFADLPEAVDLAILAIPAQYCPKAAAEAARRGVGGIFIISGGFGEAGPEGLRYQEELAEICRATGLRLLGPNTSGFINPHGDCVASFVPGVNKLSKGHVAVIAQSGGVNLSISFLIERLKEGISLAVGLGNSVDVKTADVLEMLLEDENTVAIAVHLEGVAEGRQLFEVLKRATPRKPVIALVAGRADIGEFAVSHTGNLLGSRQRTVSALRQAGAVVVDTTEELAQAAVILARTRLPGKASTSIALITGQAGPGLLIADSLKASGVGMPVLADATLQKIEKLLPPMTFTKNPVDTGRPGQTFPHIVQAAAEDPIIDAVLVFGLSEPSVLDPAMALLPAVKASGKPVIFGTLGLEEDVDPVLMGLRQQGLVGTIGPERLALAAIVLSADARGQWMLAQPRDETATAVKDRLEGSFDESRGKALLERYGITVPQRVLCRSRQEALVAFGSLRRPVVVKIAAADIVHKTEVGGVIVNVRTEDDLFAALDRIERIPTTDPGNVLIEEMAPAGVELIVGGLRDPSWGPIVVVGLGGVMAEALADSAVALVPLAVVDVEAMLDSLRGKKMLDGFRNLPRCDRAAIAAAVVAIGRILTEHPEISEIEINPLLVNENGALALDALLHLVP